jgi:hypothetical protein
MKQKNNFYQELLQSGECKIARVSKEDASVA